MVFEIHCQKGDFGGEVGATITRRELQAVEQQNLAVVDADAGGVQVAVAIAHVPVGHASFEHRRPRSQELVDVASDVVVDVA